jgi:DNA-directed RNA polymerase subunit beta'
LHPLVTPAFNADFDGDQMAVHVPITAEAVAEARYLMLGSKNILGPKDGKPIVTPTQDMVLGNYYLTFESKGKIGEGNIYRNFDDAVLAYDNKQLHLHAIIAIPVDAMDDKIKVNDSKNKVLITTVGKLIFNKIFPVDFPYFNEPTAENLDYLDDRHIILITEDIRKFIASREAISPFKKSSLSNIITKFFKQYGTQRTAEMLDNMKNLGFKFSTISGITISAQDMKAYEGKKEYFIEADKYIAEVQEFYRLGMITEREKHKLIVEK